jgi:outer membrane immunogenic protein
MRETLGRLAGCGMALFSAGAFAADVTPPPPVPQLPMGPPPFSWTGIYIGGNVGYGFADATSTIDAFGLSASVSERLTGAIAGGQFGFNWQLGSLLLGLEADYQWSGQTFSSSVFGATATDQITSFGTLRPRVGYVADHWLFYGTAGLGYGTWRTDVTAPGFSAFATSSRLTWAAGAGVEAAVTNNITVKLEYLFLDTGSIAETISGFVVNETVTDNMLRLGINFLLPIGH